MAERLTFALKEVMLAFLHSDIPSERGKSALTWICMDARNKGATTIQYEPEKGIAEGYGITLSNIISGMRSVALRYEDIVGIIAYLDLCKR